MGFGGSFGRAVGGGLQGYASTGSYYGAAAGAAAAYLNKPKKPSSGGGENTPKAPKPPPDQSSFEKPKTLDGAPDYLMTSGGLNSSMTPVQQRAQIATQATSGEDSAYRDPEVMEYYRRLAMHSLVGSKGQASGNPLPIEREYLERVLGQSPYNDSTQSFLSALLRA